MEDMTINMGAREEEVVKRQLFTMQFVFAGVIIDNNAGIV